MADNTLPNGFTTLLSADPEILRNHVASDEKSLGEIKRALTTILLNESELSPEDVQQARDLGVLDERLTTELFLAVAEVLPTLSLADEVVVQQPNGVDCTPWSITIRPPDDKQTVSELQPLAKRLAFIFDMFSHTPEDIITTIDYPFEPYEDDDGLINSRLNTDRPEIQVRYQKNCHGSPTPQSSEAIRVTVSDSDH